MNLTDIMKRTITMTIKKRDNNHKSNINSTSDKWLSFENDHNTKNISNNDINNRQ